MRTLVTGGAGYIGSHTCVELIEAGHEVIVADSLVNGSAEAVRRVAEITGAEVPLHEIDLRDRAALRGLLHAEPVDAVLHFAALKAVGESVAEPLRYYDNNLGATLTLLEVMDECGIERIVFSSSATVYGEPDAVPIDEQAALRPTNPYGWTKLMSEQFIRDRQLARPGQRAALLRYFNPAGAHPSGRIGESPQDVPNNLMPYVSGVALGNLPRLRIFGDDYPTPDGTGVRDYIHVVDLARGHVAALDALAGPAAAEAPLTLNLGTGRGYSVLEVVRAFEQASGRDIPREVVARRPGDIATCYADATLARELLGWRAERGLEAICVDAWRWQEGNPQGFEPGR
ncbi:MAG: UDP-glucose 4-epimerase GalE [Halofilum sp. (in: g-proteobacteria)]|nr:UDP-glucose 4-epimerase GalE [Halofilum sp. (in: g-proteobacteria)]